MKRLMGWAALAMATVVLCPLLALARQNPQAQDAQSGQQPGAAPAQKAMHAAPDRGQEVFDQNCSRCHNAPEGFSPRISGTIALHMRVRANLSDQDYKALLHFLNP